MNVATLTAETVWIDRAAWLLMLDLAAAWTPLETGGMLLGYLGERGEPVVTAVIGPGPKARHRRFRFAPDHDYQQQLLEQHFFRTDGRESYLGDWHTHPRGVCELSWLDKLVLSRIARTTAPRVTQPIMLVLAGDITTWTAGGARWISRSRRRLFSADEFRTLRPLVYPIEA